MTIAKALSLKLSAEIYRETEDMTQRLHTNRNAYINRALSFYNTLNKRQLLKKKLLKESQLVSGESLEMLSILDAMDEWAHSQVGHLLGRLKSGI